MLKALPPYCRDVDCETRRNKEKKRNTYYQICFSLNMLVRLLLQLLRDHRAHCFRNLGLSSKVVLISTSGWYWMYVSQP